MSNTSTTKQPQIGMSNTKKEMIDAYEFMKKSLTEKEKQLTTVEQEKAQLDKKLLFSAAEKQVEENPIQRLLTLRTDLNKELSTLSEKIEHEVAIYQKTHVAVEEKEKDLKTAYAVEAAAIDLAALLQIHSEKKEQFIKEMQEEKDSFQAEMREQRASFEKEKQRHTLQQKELQEATKKQEKREDEEYKYTLQRHREQEKNRLEDELNILERDIAQKRETFAQESTTKQAELTKREAAIAEQEDELTSMREKISVFPEELKNQIEAAVEDLRERLISDFEKQEQLLKATFTGERNVLQGKIDSLETVLTTQEKQLADFSRKYEAAYEKVQDIATTAVSSAGQSMATMAYEMSSTKKSVTNEPDQKK
ncbi:hypothetical protein [Kiloniella sp.]|uniref:hypothetical protein n=1 Tax=Kiloniella sp. TaxID=1938587 RepID=UPI003B016814